MRTIERAGRLGHLCASRSPLRHSRTYVKSMGLALAHGTTFITMLSTPCSLLLKNDLTIYVVYLRHNFLTDQLCVLSHFSNVRLLSDTILRWNIIFFCGLAKIEAERTRICILGLYCCVIIETCIGILPFSRSKIFLFPVVLFCVFDYWVFFFCLSIL